MQVRELGRTAEVLAELLVDIDDFHRGLCCVGECAGRRPCYALAHPLPCVATVDVGLAGQKLNTGSGYGKFNLKEVKNNFLKQRVALSLDGKAMVKKGCQVVIPEAGRNLRAVDEK